MPQTPAAAKPLQSATSKPKLAHRKVPSLYLRQNFIPKQPDTSKTRKNSMERERANVSSSPEKPMLSHLSRMMSSLQNSVMFDKAAKQLPRNSKTGSGHHSKVVAVQSSTRRIDPELNKTTNRDTSLNIKKALCLTKNENSGPLGRDWGKGALSSTRNSSEVETTILWKDDLAVEYQSEIELIEEIGQGSFAKVYKGIDKRSKNSVAVKVIDKRKILDSKRRKLIQSEVSILSKMKHTNIAEFYRIIEDSKRIFLLMQLCGSLTLNNFCKQFHGRKLNEEQSYAVFIQIAKGVHYMHELNIAHRDLKLTNLLIDDNYCVKIIDFGFACDASQRQLLYCGTPSYMAPEIVQKKLYLAKPVDVWSLGVILFKLLSGEYVFGGSRG
jgi:tRNA A-37 threonylcarbamoyl transferase component Bud32